MTVNMETMSNDILDFLGDPTNSNPWARRGMILGEVQSGKTATYTGLCNMAADAGYKVIIVLAGMLETLRQQTQSRLDSDFAGRQSKNLLQGPALSKNIFDGVGKIDSTRRIMAFTTGLYDELFPLCGKFGLWITSLWHYMPDMSREGRGGGVCPDCSGRGGRLPPRPKFRCPAPVFLSDHENWCEGTVWGLRS